MKCIILFCFVLFSANAAAFSYPSCNKAELNSVPVDTIKNQNYTNWTAFISDWKSFECLTLKEPIPVDWNNTLNSDTVHIFNNNYTIISLTENFTILYHCEEKPSPEQSPLVVLMKYLIENFDGKVKIFKNGNETTIKLNGTCVQPENPVTVPPNTTPANLTTPPISSPKTPYIFETTYKNNNCFRVKNKGNNITDERNTEFNRTITEENKIYKDILVFKTKNYTISRKLPILGGIEILRILNEDIKRNDSFYIFSNSTDIKFTEKFTENNQTYTITTNKCPTTSSGSIMAPLLFLSIITVLLTTIFNS